MMLISTKNLNQHTITDDFSTFLHLLIPGVVVSKVRGVQPSMAISTHTKQI
ncbi:hypothetical protein THF1A12_50072 [Vibrio jasicida]|uniref:Uncharacterized protein n=1 Tax=Vibrio jasicida TaxID=766224 RepID=A0AAU9QTR9_9VIBR|nr:hypothetical protein THF1A12_50072 [Vibrio jasicida]